MAKNSNSEGITLNGPIFGAVMTALLVALIVGFIIGAILTGGLLIPLVAFLAFLGIILTFAFYALRAFYHWASHGFKPNPDDVLGSWW